MSNWYLARDRRRHGPFTRAQIEQMVAAGQISPSDLMLEEGLQVWVTAGSIDGLLFPPTLDDVSTTPPAGALRILAKELRPHSDAPATAAAPGAVNSAVTSQNKKGWIVEELQRTTKAMWDQAIRLIRTIGYGKERKTPEHAEPLIPVTAHERIRVAIGYSILGLLLLVFLGFSLRSRTARDSGVSIGDATSIPIKAAPNVDERLFLMNVLETLYGEMPANLQDRVVAERALAALRRRGGRFHEYVSSKNLDPALTQLYADLLATTDDYIDFLSRLGQIDREAVIKADQELNKVSASAGFTGGLVAAETRNRGASGGKAAMSGLIAFGLQALLEGLSKQQVLDEAKRRAFEAAGQELQRRVAPREARLQNSAAAMSEKYGWLRGEVGFDETSEQAERLQRLIMAGDYQGALRIVEAVSRRRPRNPFLARDRCFLAALVPNTSSAVLLARARECASAASLVPEGRIYDDYRGQVLFIAGLIAMEGAKKEKKGEAAAYAVNLFDATLRYDPQDTSAGIRESRAWALMLKGDLKQALAQATEGEVYELRKSDVHYAYNLACLYSLLNQPDKSIEWLQIAIRNLGLKNIALVRNDPDLATVRTQRAAAFEQLTTLKYEWWIGYGTFNDDILLRNDSPFALTNVVLKVTVTAGERTWNQEVRVDRLESGKTYKWVNVISVPRKNSSRADLRCEQE